MRKVISLLMLIGLFWAAPAFACKTTFEEKVTAFAERDTDADAFLSLEEYYQNVSDDTVLPADKQAYFASIDTDGDGRLNFHEFTAGTKKRC